MSIWVKNPVAAESKQSGVTNLQYISTLNISLNSKAINVDYH